MVRLPRAASDARPASVSDRSRSWLARDVAQAEDLDAEHRQMLSWTSPATSARPGGLKSSTIAPVEGSKGPDWPRETVVAVRGEAVGPEERASGTGRGQVHLLRRGLILVQLAGMVQAPVSFMIEVFFPITARSSR